MQTRTPLVAALLLAMPIAGCLGASGEDGTGTFTFHLVDDAPGDIRLNVSSLSIHPANASMDTWVSVAGNGTLWDLSGSGDDLQADATVPAGSYDLLAIRFSEATVDGTPAAMAGNGFNMPFEFSVTDGGTTDFEIRFGWADSVFDSEEGVAFYPVPVSLRIVQDGSETLALEDASALDTRIPVARARIFQHDGFVMFNSDFEAADAAKRVVGTAGTLTLSGTNSEVLAPGATITAHDWYVDDELVASGPTVQVPFPISGGNFTIRLEATDSNGKTDDVTVPVALAPGSLRVVHRFEGNASGVNVYETSVPDPVPGLGGTPVVVGTEEGDVSFQFNVTTTESEGTQAQLVRVVGTFTSVDDATGVGTDVEMVVLDSDGGQIGSAGFDDTFSRDYPIGAPPVGGNWTVEIDVSQSAGTWYRGEVRLYYAGINEEMTAFLAGYDDGHTHCHPGVDEVC